MDIQLLIASPSRTSSLHSCSLMPLCQLSIRFCHVYVSSSHCTYFVVVHLIAQIIHCSLPKPTPAMSFIVPNVPDLLALLVVV